MIRRLPSRDCHEVEVWDDHDVERSTSFTRLVLFFICIIDQKSCYTSVQSPAYGIDSSQPGESPASTTVTLRRTISTNIGHLHPPYRSKTISNERHEK